MYIGPICKAFIEIYKDYKNIMAVTITTAYVPDKKIKDEILSKLAQVTKKELEVSEVIDEDIIGGFKLDFEDYQYDNSIKVHLKRLSKTFTENLYKSKI
jgi:F-type H+-transporting ATPase subunit delta